MSSRRIPALVKKLGTGGVLVAAVYVPKSCRRPKVTYCCIYESDCGMLWMQNGAKKVIFAGKKGMNMNMNVKQHESLENYVPLIVNSIYH